jgi:hypothetical protein
MNKNVATLLCINHTQLADFRAVVPRYMKQSAIPDLSAHLSVKRRSIEDDVKFFRSCPWQNCLDKGFRLQKIVAKKSRWLRFQLPFFHTDFFLLLCLARALTLFLHQLFESANIDCQSAFTRH